MEPVSKHMRDVCAAVCGRYNEHSRCEYRVEVVPVAGGDNRLAIQAVSHLDDHPLFVVARTSKCPDELIVQWWIKSGVKCGRMVYTYADEFELLSVMCNAFNIPV